MEKLRETAPPTFQDMVFRLSAFWAGQGCVVALPYDLEVGAGTMCPETFFRVLGPQPWRVAYVQPSRRPADGRYGENPNRLLKHTQMQVILKPPPANIQDVYLDSLGALGIELRHHDIRFEEDNWEAPTLGAWGIGWQVMLDGLEITQFTYFQQSGGVDLEPISVELTYGLDRLAAFLQNAEDVYHVRWNETVTYGEMRRPEELELSVYDFEKADPEVCRKILDLYEGEASRLLEEYRQAKYKNRNPKFENRNSKMENRSSKNEIQNPRVSSRLEVDPQAKHEAAETSSSNGLTSGEEHSLRIEQGNSQLAPNFDFRVSNFDHSKGQQSGIANTSSYTLTRDRFPLRKVYDLALKCSHLFNILDARGAISVTERVALIARVRKLACAVAAIYLDRLTAPEVAA
jgi:glycyl-tRNA synthetase alpha chain